MPSLLEFSINVFVLALIILIAAILGFLARGAQVRRKLDKIDELEREVLSNYAQILELEKENTALESKLQDITIPVIAMKATVQEENKKVPDITLRKQLLSKENLQKQIATGK
jgi:ABC-type siderophore export system fused ATPase/permease subunit